MLQPIWLTSVYNNTYWNIGTVPVACVEIGTTVCATFEILLAGPTLLWAGIDTPSQSSDRGR